MTDCPNANVRDLLPDLLHDRLDSATRAMAEAHVASCADCQEELALLRDIHGAARRAPRLDLAAIAGAVPSYRAPVQRAWVSWRTAAAITLMVAGGSSIVVLRGNVSPVSDTLALAPSGVTPPASGSGVTMAPRAEMPARAPSRAMAVQPQASSPDPTAPVSDNPAPVRAGRELALSGGSLNDLSDRELAMLLKEIESLDAVPTTDVENSAISPIAPGRIKP